LLLHLHPRQICNYSYRDRASAHIKFRNRGLIRNSNQTCTATLVMLNQICTWTAKTHAISSLHRDSYAAKVPGLCPVLASGNAYLLYCRAVGCNRKFPYNLTINKIAFATLYRIPFILKQADTFIKIKKASNPNTIKYL
jgi:hypothetical protein